MTERPRQVSTALRLLWTSLGLGLVTSALDWSYVGAVASAGFTVAVLLVVLGLTAFLIVKMGAGRNWARITFLVLFLAGAAPYVPNLIAMYGRSLLTGTVSLLQLVLQIVALYLLFTRPGADWFRRTRVASSG